MTTDRPPVLAVPRRSTIDSSQKECGQERFSVPIATALLRKLIHQVDVPQHAMEISEHKRRELDDHHDIVSTAV